jgi:dihydroxyacetone kinase-like predicted kinase
MSKINLDKRLIDESLRIREEYLKKIEEIKKNEDLFNNVKDELNNTYLILEGSDIDKEFIENKILKLTKDINKIENLINNILYKIDILKKDADKLFEKIKEKYSDITEEELINILYPYIKKLDGKFENILNKNEK